MAVLLGKDLSRLDRDQLAASLLKTGTKRVGNDEAQAHWLSIAGLTRPQGRISERAQGDIARMGELYGIYDPDAQTLTDLGQVLLAVEPWRGGADDPSPFCWTGAKRFLGLRLVLGVNGDMVLALLRRFPASGTLARGDGMKMLADSIRDLLSVAVNDDDRAELARQVERLDAFIAQASKTPKLEHYHRGQHVLPQLEPIRELGYVQAGEQAGEYMLTAAGERLRAALPDVPADVLLEEGLSRVFFAGEGVPLGRPAHRVDLRDTLRDLPENLHASATEAPLEPVVLLTQCRLVSSLPGIWIDTRSAKELIGEISRDSRGRVGLKSATLGGSYNISWTSPDVLSDDTLWSVEALEARPTNAHGVPDAVDGRGEAIPARSATVAGARTSAEPPRVSILSPTGSAEMKPPLDELTAQMSLLSILYERVRTCTPPPDELHLRLWFKYVSELLDAPAPGGVASTSFGGPRAWMDTLIQYLDHPKLVHKRGPFPAIFPPPLTSRPPLAARAGAKGRETNIVALAPLESWLDAVGAMQSTEPIRRCVRLWADTQGTDGSALRGELLWAYEALDQLAEELAQSVVRFLVTPATHVDEGSWEAAREATRALVEDAVHRGFWRREELRVRLHEGVTGAQSGARNRLEVAKALLADLTSSPAEESFTHEQDFSVPHWLQRTLVDLTEEQRRLNFKGADVELSPTKLADEAVAEAPGVATITATVALRARTPLQAWSRGEEYAHDALSRLRFLALLRSAGGLPPQSEERVIEPGAVRFARSDGSSWEPSVASEELDVELEKPATLGFVRIDLRIHECRVQDLPGLAQIDRGGHVDGKARLTRALHWLSTAEDRGERPGERLSHAWVALEHLVTDGGESKLPVVLEHVPAAVALCHLRSTIGSVYREALTALHVVACKRWKDPLVTRIVDTWLGPEARPWYASHPDVVSRFMEERRIDDAAALQTLSSQWSDIADLATVIEGSAPFASCRLHQIEKVFSNPERRRELLYKFQVDAACLLTQVYDVRNQLVHDANPFGFDDAYRLHVLYDRYRALIDPVVAEMLRLVMGRPGARLSHAWSLMRARFAELVDVSASGGGLREQRVLRCLAGL